MKIQKETQKSFNCNKKAYFIFSMVLFLMFALGGIMGVFVYPTFFTGAKDKDELQNITQKGQRQGGKYKFINPLLECDYSSDLEYKNIYSIEKKVSEIIERLVDGTNVSSVSLYYRDLNNGPWFGINEDENYKPASLLKVPVFIAYLKKIENNLGLLSSTLSYKENELEMPDPADNLESLAPEKEYTLEKLFERMVVNSDNQAYTLLVNRIDTKELDQVMQDLGMTVPDSNLTENILTAKSYASLFRVLYNSSYVSRSASEYALTLMSYARFDSGITKDLPEEIAISHKFGLRKSEDLTGDVYLHDCGIVYYPEKP